MTVLDKVIEYQLEQNPQGHRWTAVSYPAGEEYVDYTEDMVALVPMIQQFLMAVVTVDNLNRYPELKDTEGYLEGWDYHDPALTIRAIQEWVKIRNAQSWENPDRYELKRIYDALREKVG